MLQFLPHQNGLTLIMLSFFCMVIKKIVALTNLSQQNTLFTHTKSALLLPDWQSIQNVWLFFPCLVTCLKSLSMTNLSLGQTVPTPRPLGQQWVQKLHALPQWWQQQARPNGQSWGHSLNKKREWWVGETPHKNTLTHHPFFYQLLTLFCTLPLLVLLDACMSNLFHKQTEQNQLILPACIWLL